MCGSYLVLQLALALLVSPGVPEGHGQFDRLSTPHPSHLTDTKQPLEWNFKFTSEVSFVLYVLRLSLCVYYTENKS